jgi:hypothetical protein
MMKTELMKINESLDGTNQALPKQRAQAKFLPTLMFNGANRARYGDLRRNIVKNLVTETSEYLESPDIVLHILNAYQPPCWN